MPALVRLYIQSVALGFGIAGAFTAGLLWFDVAGLGHLVMASDIGWVAVLMLVVFNGIVFSAVQFAFRIMGWPKRTRARQAGAACASRFWCRPLFRCRCATVGAEAPNSSKTSDSR